MTWSTLEAHAQRLGFEVAFNTKPCDGGGFMADLTPPKGNDWQWIGSYAQMAGLWVKPSTDTARKISTSAVNKLMLDSDPFVETPGTFDDDALAADARFLLAIQNQE
jgi:hypothetical protein